MSDDPKTGKTDEGGEPKTPGDQAPLDSQPGPPPGLPVYLQLPGLAAISLYMLFLAGTVILGVATHHFPPFYLFFPVLFFAAGLGLMLLLRWAWALALAAVVLLLGVFLYEYAQQHALALLVQGLLNFVFFLYLVRTEVRSKLR